MQRLPRAYVWAAVALFAACGRGVSSDPFEYRTVAGAREAAPLLALGAAGCEDASDCEAGSCAVDVNEVPRCCERNCALETGRVCSRQGLCVCSERYEEVSGRCLLRGGEPCEGAGECASGYCADGVCCDAACERVCERCDAAGACVFDEDDAACDGEGLACTGPGRCRLTLGYTCNLDSDCDSGQCEPAVTGQSICCDRECDGLCEKCGADGSCSVPEADERCPIVASCDDREETACVRYAPPLSQACASFLECAGCAPIYTRAGASCGIGSQCDGTGECTFTGRGLVAAGLSHTCAVLDSGNVRCWGSNEVGQLGAAFDQPFVGDDETPGSVLNLEIDFNRRVVQVAVGAGHTCVLFEDGNVRCWGGRNPLFGDEEIPSLLGTNDVERDAAGFVDPLNTGDVRLSAPAVQISAGWSGEYTCAVLRDGQVSCWGVNLDGQCGIGIFSAGVGGTAETLPTIDLAGRAALEVRAGALHTCVLLEGGDVSCWGNGRSGMTGHGDGSLRPKPDAFVDVGDEVTQLAVSPTHTCALLIGGRVRCWGANARGQLGYGHAEAIGDDETPAIAAVQMLPGFTRPLGGDVAGQTGVEQIVALDTAATCALAGTSVECWGDNVAGQLGYGHDYTLSTQYTPLQLESHTIVDSEKVPTLVILNAHGHLQFGRGILALADNGRCASSLPDEDGRRSLFCWGRNDRGQLGLPQVFPNGTRTQKPLDVGPVEWTPP